MLRRVASLVVCAGALALPAAAGEQAPYLDPDRPIEVRIKDLVSRMTLEEKIGQLSSSAPAIPRLNVPAYDWWNESLHGVARGGRATVFPQAIGLAATFDTELMGRVAEAIADEARAKHHAAVRAGYRDRYHGLTFWTPNINIFRDPRWGRGQETYGEDPFLTAAMGVAFVKGLQGPDPDRIKAAACAKHFAVHSGPEGERHSFNAVAGPQDMNETYLPAFKALVEAGVEAVMCAYNRTNGEPCCGSQALLVDTLRGRWSFKGHVVSDCGAIPDFDKNHKVTKDPAESAALALRRGTDLACTDYSPLREAVQRGLVTEEQVDAALVHLLRTKFRLGFFDPEDRQVFARVPESAIASPEHRRLAREAAVKSLVLLKNRDAALPLRKDVRKVFVTGPYAADAAVLLGNYYGVNEDMATVLQGIVGKVSAATSVEFRPGCLPDRPNADPFSPGSYRYAQEADATIAVMGISNLIEGEEGAAIASPTRGDRLDLRLPPNQVEFLRALRVAAKKLVVVMMGGSPIASPEVDEMADAVLFVWYPGQEGGRAVADVLFGDVAPSGRLPITFPRSVDQLPPFEDYSMVGRTYRYMTAKPLYPFGFGLSYTRFGYGPLDLSRPQASRGEKVSARVRVTNAGAMAADEVVQLYVTPLSASGRVPLAALKAVKRVSLAPGAATTVEFSIEPALLTVVDEAGNETVGPGQFRLTVGGASPGALAVTLGAPEPARAILTIE
ncbi:MAG TPA: glycoside hydrolase family 3 C-terminal domain-containing protein [Vicinamibacteria bacterium]|nr:glycoside hydrolase family 3 C-terminal domain-containing protein [Vicinamibacteria bacterium]